MGTESKRASVSATAISEAARKLGAMLQPGGLAPYGGVRIYVDANITETEEYEQEVTRSFRERWIEPILHGVTIPFEPWVRTKWVSKTRQIPSMKALARGGILYVHPALFERLKLELALQPPPSIFDWYGKKPMSPEDFDAQYNIRPVVDEPLTKRSQKVECTGRCEQGRREPCDECLHAVAAGGPRGKGY